MQHFQIVTSECVPQGVADSKFSGPGSDIDFNQEEGSDSTNSGLLSIILISPDPLVVLAMDNVAVYRLLMSA